VNIQRLEPDVVNQIAAGEVIERPANVVKELVENALDAEATEISVELDNGGRWLRISDNGHGIAKDDLVLATERHATSKITKSSDLWNLHSFGFRGEALASISAVSSLTLHTKQPQAQTGWQIKNEFGQLSEPEKISSEKGTKIIISDLFSNVPARLKFLKSDVAETTQIKKVIKAFALQRPGVSFRIRQQGKLMLFWPATKEHQKRVQQVLDWPDVYMAQDGDGETTAKVFFSSPQGRIRTSQGIWLFAQGRWIQDRALQVAIIDAFRSLLMHGEFPQAVAFIDCLPDNIDVNIHPTKSQVKFRDQRAVFRLLQGTLRSQVEKAPWSKGYSVPKAQSTRPLTDGSEQHQFQTSDYQRTSFPTKTSFRGSQSHSAPVSENTPTLQELQTLAPPKAVQQVSDVVRDQDLLSNKDIEAKPFFSSLQVIGQANLTFIVAQSSRSLFLIDQHASHERIAYEKIMQAWKSKDIEIQNYLIPLSLEFAEDRVEALIQKSSEIKDLGIEVEQQGPTTIAVSAAPLILKEEAISKALEQLAEEIIEKGDGFALEKTISDICATLACHSVVRAGQALSTEQMQNLLAQMDEFPLSSYCPHGRPVFVEYPFQKLDRDFGRIV
jgi:DNA mismatch repair protein MutL